MKGAGIFDYTKFKTSLSLITIHRIKTSNSSDKHLDGVF